MKQTKVIARIMALLFVIGLLAGTLPQKAEAAGFAALVTASGMKVYTDSALQRSAGTIAQGEVVVVNAYSGQVAKVTYSGRTGYAAVKDMAKVSDVCQKAKVVATSARAYESKSTSARSIALNKGLTVYLVDTDGKWARIAAGSRVGYTNIDWLEVEGAAPTATPEPTAAPNVTASLTGSWIAATVKASSVKVYTAPRTDGRVLTTLKKGTALNVVDYTKTWAHVEKNGYYGYCLTSALAPAAQTATVEPTATPTPTPAATVLFTAVVTASSVKVYSSENAAGGTLLGTLKKGAQVNVIGYNSNWAHIELNGRYGYCATNALAKATEAEPTATPAATPRNAIPATVTAASVKVYASASTSAKSLGTLKRGAQVNVVDANSTWAFIELNGRYGFCKRAALTRSSDLPMQFQATVIAPNTPAYASRSTGAASATLAIGATVDVYAYDDTWAYVGKGTVRGFVEVKYLNRDSFAEISSGDTGDAVLNLQKALEALGYFDGVPAGNYSTMTTEAVKRFQAAIGLEQTGNADLTVLRVIAGGYAPGSLLLNATLSRGNTGTNVTRLQTRLYAKGYLSKTASVDGDYGSVTVAAVKLFQKKAGLSETGTADSGTLRSLYANDAPALGSGNAADYTAPTPTATTPITSTDTPGSNTKIETVITAAKNQLGKPYVYGAMGMSSFDCSGLTSYAFKQVGISLNRTAYGQGYNDGVKITGLSNLVRGDIVCMNTISDNDLSDHVGIYLGGGQMIHASSGAGKVIISSLTSGYYNRVFSWGRRIIR